jgi:hypothetical protein
MNTTMELDSTGGRQPAVTNGEWLAEDRRQFQLLVDYPPPRPYGYLDQLRADARDWRCVALWLFCAGSLALAATPAWPVAFVGAWLIWRFFKMLRATVHSCRVSPLCIGVLEGPDGRHPVLRHVLLVRVRLLDGLSVRVALAARLASAVSAKAERVQVLVLYESAAAFSPAIGVRAMPRTTEPA